MSTLPPGRRGLRISLLAGAAYDLILGFFVLILGRRVLEMMGHPLSEPEFYFSLATLPLFLLPVLYTIAAFSDSIAGFRPAVLWARAGGGLMIILLTGVHNPEAAWVFWCIGIIDLGWAGIHALMWREDAD